MKEYKNEKIFIDWLKQYRGYPLPGWNDRINILGIRNENDMAKDIFNDMICLILDNKDLIVFEGTTDPGKYYTEHATKEWGVAGVAHLVEGWYPHVWTIGPHMGETALVQYGNAVTVWRDVNKDFIFDPDTDLVQTGYFGLNCHYTHGDPEHIGRWGAGCQVIKYRSDWLEFLRLVESYNEKYYNYLLINKTELQNNFLG